MKPHNRPPVRVVLTPAPYLFSSLQH
jgi:hypothetical protein